MTNLLVKWFVKDYKNVEQAEVRTRYGVMASLVGVCCNLFLFLIKVLVGILIHSISVIADAFNNLSDAASSVISFVGVKLAERPADKEHPFGHGRYEYIAGLAVAFLVLQVGFSCFGSSLDKIWHPQEVAFSWYTVLILCIPIAVKIWMGVFNRTLGKRIQSTVLKATAADSFGDVCITGATVLSLVVGHISGLKIDGFMGVIVSVFVMIAGIKIIKETLEPLLGEAVPMEVYRKVTDYVESYPCVYGRHDLIVHNYGPTKLMATIHAEVANDLDIEDIHEEIDMIERNAMEDLGILLVIHMDPIAVHDERLSYLKKRINEIVKEIEPHGSIHDLRIVNGVHQINLIFDLTLPHERKEHADVIRQQVIAKMRAEDERYTCVIQVEHGYISEG